MEEITFINETRRTLVLAQRAIGPQARIRARADANRAINAALDEMLFQKHDAPSTSYPPASQRQQSGFLNPDITS